jgi:ubiquinone/menaquinone biosynthesis C-methylase UbiE
MTLVASPDPRRTSHPRVRFDLWPAAWDDYVPFLERLIDRTGARRVCDVGAGARPSLPLEMVAERELDYVLLDISEVELAKAPDRYAKVRADITAADFDAEEQFDLVVTRMVAEHIQRPDAFHANVNRLLVPNGTAFHFFATLYALPFVVNRFLPGAIGDDILTALRPVEARGRPKFRAYYRWCRGPTARQIRRFTRAGFDVEEYVGFFGHSYYGKLGPIQALENSLARLLVSRPVPLLTSFAYVVLRKRLESEPGALAVS